MIREAAGWQDDEEWDLEMLREQQEMIERECRLKYELHLRREQDARLAQEQVHAFRRHSHLTSPHAHSCSALLLPPCEATAGSAAWQHLDHICRALY